MQHWQRLVVIIAASGVLAACSGGSGSSNSEAGRKISVNGKFDPSQLAGLSTLGAVPEYLNLGIKPMAISHDVYCMTFSEPSHTASSSVSAVTGEFAPAGQAMGCFFVTKNSGVMLSWIAMVKEAKSSSQSGKGDVGQDGYAMPNDATKFEFGDINVSTTGGQVVVTAPNAAADGDLNTVPVFQDMTGEWTIASLSSHPCEFGGGSTNPEQLQECKNLWSSAPVYLHTFKVSNSSTSEERSYISLWQSKEQFDACDTEGMTFSGSWDTAASKVKTALPLHHSPEINWKNLTPEVLQTAKFRVSYGDTSDITNNNCPYNPVGSGPGFDPNTVIIPTGGKDAYAQCVAAKSCADFNYANMVDGTKAKMACVHESLSSRSADEGYQWNRTGVRKCGRSLAMHYSAFQEMMADITTTAGCDNDGCGKNLDTYFSKEPKYRRFMGELFTAGNLGSGVSAELDKSRDGGSGGGSVYFCYMFRQLSFKITQESATSVVMALTMNVSPRQGEIQLSDIPASPDSRDPEAGDEGKPWFDTVKCMEKDWIAREFSSPGSMKITLKKK